MDIENLKKNQDFIDFYCQKEDKWFQNTELIEKINAVFGNSENAIKEFEKYRIENNL